MERQIHGFKYQEELCKKKNLTPVAEYTGKWDALTQEQKPVVIKCFKDKSELPLSDIFINSERNEDFIICCGIWRGSKYNIIEEIEVEVDIQKWKKYFEFEEYENLKDWIKNKVSNERSYDSTWKQECELWKSKWGKERLVQPRFKRDHKTQRRIQCAVSFANLTNFLNEVKK